LKLKILFAPDPLPGQPLFESNFNVVFQSNSAKKPGPHSFETGYICAVWDKKN